ncbi:MAG: hypothetical protein ABIT07_04720 [Ferruginibacter sp.]
MRHITNAGKKLIFLLICFAFVKSSTAQLDACVFKDSLFNIDFGSATKTGFFNLSMLKEYRLDNSTCPNDGFYAFQSHTADCFNRDWLTLAEDHTPGDEDGKMMFVNSANRPGMFFITILNGFRPNTNYELGLWMMNLCKLHSACAPIPPEISIILETTDGKTLTQFNTGVVTQADVPVWKRYYGFFTTPAETSTLVLKMINHVPGGCGNDFAVDDITVRQCYPPPPEIKEQPVVQKSPAPVAQKVPPPKKTLPPPAKKNTSSFPLKKDTLKKTIPVSIASPGIPIPDRIRTRQNAVVKEIEIAAGEVRIELYDNGIVDGDTVSIYHNNKLVISRAGISENPVRLNIAVDKSHPHHEIVMVAENLGSIPPNTSLMIVTAKDFRKEVFISSTEQKNAKVIIDLKDQD